MADKGGRVGKYDAACNVIGVVVAVDHILHRRPETIRKLRFEPLRKIETARVGHDDTFRGDQNHGVVGAAPSFIEIAHYVNDLPSGTIDGDLAITLCGAGERDQYSAGSYHETYRLIEHNLSPVKKDFQCTSI